MFKTVLTVACLLCGISLSVSAQTEKDRWQRVSSGEDSVIDVNVSSLVLDGRFLHVSYRTVLAKQESLKEKPATKYKSRLETIEFSSAGNRYRIQEISLLDAAGKTVETYEAAGDEEWRAIKDGGIMRRLFDAARRLPPFGDWKVVDYRLADGAPANAPELQKLIGTSVRLDPDRAEVGGKICNAVAYQSRRVTDKEFLQELAISLESIGIKTSYAETAAVRCEAKDWAPSQSLLLKLPEGGMLMLWEGVFLVLKEQRSKSESHPLILRRRASTQ